MGKEEANSSKGVDTPAKNEVIFGICGKNRESTAKNRKDLVGYGKCERWSHLSCYKLAKCVVEWDEVTFCFFCMKEVMTMLALYQSDQKTLETLRYNVNRLKGNKFTLKGGISRLRGKIEGLENKCKEMGKPMQALKVVIGGETQDDTLGKREQSEHQKNKFMGDKK